MSSQQQSNKWHGLHPYLALFARQPSFSALVLGMTILGMLTDGLGLLMLVPLLGTLTGDAATSPIVDKLFGLWQKLGLNPSLVTILAVFLALMALRAVVRVAKDWASMHLRTSLTDDLRNTALAALMQAEWRWLNTHKRSDQTNMLLTEVQRVGTGVYAALSLLATGAAIAAYLVVAFGLEPMVTALVAVLGGLLLVLFSKLRRNAMQLGHEQLYVNRALHENALESVGAIKLAKILGTQKGHIDSFAVAVSSLRHNQIRFTLLSGLSREAFQFAGAVLVAGYVFLGVSVWQIPLAQLLALVFIFARLVPMLTAFQQHLQILANALPALTEAQAIIANARAAAEPAIHEGTASLSPSAAVSLNDVSVSFTADTRPALQNVNLLLKVGSITVISGSSGAGKSTVADVLMGLLPPDQGQLCVDDTPIEGARRMNWRRSVSYVPQDVVLYAGSIRDNLLRARQQASDNQITAALLAASADFVTKLPDGIDTLIGDGAKGLSGGERQRLALARGLLRQPALLVLDEVTSALDPENEAKIRDSIARLAGQMTIVILGHRHAFLDIADQVLHMHDGKISPGTGRKAP